MKEIKCPLCHGRGKLAVKRSLKVLGEVGCPICDGDGKIYVVEPSDVVDVEVVKSNSGHEYAIIHKKDCIGQEYRYARMSVEEVFRRWKEAYFCSHCYGEYIVYKDRLIRGTD